MICYSGPSTTPWSSVLTTSQVAQSKQKGRELGLAPRPGTCRARVWRTESAGPRPCALARCRELLANTGYCSRHSTVSSFPSPCRDTTPYLVHHGGPLPVGRPVHSAVTVVDGVALHVHLRGERLAALRDDRRYLLHFEQINLQPLSVVVCLWKWEGHSDKTDARTSAVLDQGTLKRTELKGFLFRESRIPGLLQAFPVPFAVTGCILTSPMSPWCNRYLVTSVYPSSLRKGASLVFSLCTHREAWHTVGVHQTFVE